jgi:hypothetical protein
MISCEENLSPSLEVFVSNFASIHETGSDMKAEGRAEITPPESTFWKCNNLYFSVSQPPPQGSDRRSESLPGVGLPHLEGQGRLIVSGFVRTGLQPLTASLNPGLVLIRGKAPVNNLDPGRSVDEAFAPIDVFRR